MSLSDKSRKSETIFYALAAAGVAGVVGGLYYLYSSFFEENLTEEELIEIEEIKNDLEKHGKLDQDLAMRILYMTNHHAEEEIKKTHPLIDKKRREALKDEQEYKRICMEYLEAKEFAYQNSSKRIMTEFNTTFEEVQQMLSNLDPTYMEKKFFEFEQPKFEHEKPNKEIAKEAFLFYGKKLMEEMQGLSSQSRNFQFLQSPEGQQEMMFNLLVGKMKVEDLLYIKYKLSENHVRYLLQDYNLLSDPEIQAVYARIGQLEQMMG